MRPRTTHQASCRCCRRQWRWWFDKNDEQKVEVLKRGGYNTKAPSWYFGLGSQMGTWDGTDIEVLGTECKNLTYLGGQQRQRQRQREKPRLLQGFQFN